jgi:hypothetical protein
MRQFIASALVATILAANVDEPNRVDELFSSWRDAQTKMKSLVVDFSYEIKDSFFGRRMRFQGSLRLLRTADGELLGRYVLKETGAKSGTHTDALLNHGSVYLFNHDDKMAFRFDAAGDDLAAFLERYFNPFVALLDKKRAEKNWRVEVTKQDDSYTYLSVKPKEGRGLQTGLLHEGRVVLMNKDSGSLSKHMPRQLWYADAVGSEYTFEVKSWRLNATEPPNLDEFTRPEERPGWKIFNFPFTIGATKK